MKSGKIIESSGKSVEARSVNGLFDCVLEHAVKETKAEFNWTGPAITPAVWNEVLAFFRWTQVEHKSEAQVRLFVHPVNGWMAWAFPQKGGTWLTSKEVETPATALQRSQIPEGFVAFGTVHHHCNMSAFQSGTDTHDEKGVDGLHITVGDLEKEQYSLHCRLYIKGNKFEPNMSAFWEIGAETAQKILFVEELGFESVALCDKAARRQMGRPAPADFEFNPVWKENYLIDRPVITTTFPATGAWPMDDYNCYGHNHHVHTPGSYGEKNYKKGKKETKDHKTTYFPHTGKKKLSRVEVYDNIVAIAACLGYPDEVGVMTAISELGDSQETDLYQVICDECADGKIMLKELSDEADARLKRYEQEELAKETTEEAKENGAATQDDVARLYMEGNSID